MRTVIGRLRAGEAELHASILASCRRGERAETELLDARNRGRVRLAGRQRLDRGDHRAGELGRRARAGGDPDPAHPREPLRAQVGGGVDEERRLAGPLLDHLDEAEAVAAAAAAHHHHAVDVGGGEHRRLLALLGGEADLVVHLDVGEPLDQPVDDRLGVPHRERRLAGDGQPGAGGEVELLDLLDALDEGDVVGGDAQRALRLGVAALADVDDVVALAGQPADQVVGAGDVAAGGVDDVQAAALRLVDHLRRDAVGGEDDRARLDLLEARHAIGGVDQRHPVLLELAGDVLVVDQVAEHGHRLAGGALVADPLGDPDRLDHAVAVAARGDAHHLHLGVQSTPGRRRRRPPPRRGDAARRRRRGRPASSSQQYRMAPITAPTSSLAAAGRPEGDTYASTSPETISREAAPAARPSELSAALPNASLRLQQPGPEDGVAEYRPVAPAMTMMLSSRTPWGTISDQKARS